MKRTYLQEADPHAVSAGVRRVLEAGGAMVKEHVSTHVRFESLPPQRPAWRRDGYVGIYQPFGDPDVEVRLILRARWPWRLLWGAAAFNILLFVVLLVNQPSGSAWYAAAALMALLLLVTGIVYLHTLHAARTEERAWMGEFEEDLARALPEAGLVTSQDYGEQRAMEALEGKIVEARLDQARKDAPKPVKEKGSRFSLGKKAAPPPEESAEEKRARLLARKAALEAEQRDEPEGQR